MHLIKLNAIDSTNSYLRKRYLDGDLQDFTVVSAAEQTSGRGQMGTVWESDPGKNLMLSVFKKIDCLAIEQQFYVSMASSLAVLKTLKKKQIPSLSVKWPNDILSDNRKICGVLIESIIRKQKLDAIIVGIGLNVNQTTFNKNFPASSLKNLTGVNYNLDEVLHDLLEEVKHYVSLLVESKLDEISQEYHQHLFRKEKPSTFKDQNDNLIMGFIKGVSNSGRLQVLLEDEVLKEFDMKEIKLMY
ncbi:biotin--[acetyl-CoA-carboxylase] ligase [Spongiivirga citrea]|uniref:Biotin--[acetyl-CoA-carboxylase] ligase n=1 Tax=Spongiivirga citrea TaxID=1481457 RepID=A0A6M0CKJ2_9FLAO|nr:biotin--[acetyl-CoA-carboxylase] ligase [Spongiivirga citrea]NER18401.1 biotin--[acetyl-CoA-carboxylase] ligase [Spongiivirga citrea]